MVNKKRIFAGSIKSIVNRMKKGVIYFLFFLVLGLTGCNNKLRDASNVDAVLLNQGKLSFYHLKSQKLIPYEKETDSVINMLFDDHNHLYYTVSNNRQLSLKMLDMNQHRPEPKFCADWNTSLDLVYDDAMDRVLELVFDKAGENIYLYRMDPLMGYMTPVVYNIGSRSVREVGEDEEYQLRYDTPNCNTSRCFTENQLFYYVTPEGKCCLNDKIHFEAYFENEDERRDLEFLPLSLSPDGKAMVYSAVVYWGEGWGYYCVANLDGSMQTLLGSTDIWDDDPQWLDDTTLIFVENVEIPMSDPAYDPEGPVSRPSIVTFDTRNNRFNTVSLGSAFAVRPSLMPERKEMQQTNLEGCDVAIFDHGKVTFYNSESDMFVPYVVDDDSIVNGVFVDDYAFYYTVNVGDGLYLKQIYLGEYVLPVMVTDWDLALNDCVSETYGKVSPLVWIKATDRIGISHNFSWDFYDFSDIRFYDMEKKTKLNGWREGEEEEAESYDEESQQFNGDYKDFVVMDGRFYYDGDGRETCLSDKINFMDYVSDPEYFSEQEFELCSIDPTRRLVAYVAYLEWGDLGHGPLCVASLDGKMQLALGDTDAADLSFGWLSNGSLLFVGRESRPANDPDYDPEWNNTKPCVKIVRPDGTIDVFAHAEDFVVK